MPARANDLLSAKDLLGVSENKPSLPLIKVQVCNLYVPALLDTGASLSAINNEIYEQVKLKGIKTHPSLKQITMVSGSILTTETVNLSVTWPGGKRRQQFFIIPDLKQPVILGRDFITACGIVMNLKDGGWSIGSEPQKIIPYDKIEPIKKEEIQEVQETDELNCVDVCNFISSIDEIYIMFEEHTVFADAVVESKKDNNFSSILANLNLPNKEAQIVKNIFDKFSCLFIDKPGTFGNYRFTIDTGNSKPIKCHPRPMTLAKRELLKELVQKLIDQDLIEPGSGPWASNPVIVQKKNGKYRLCIDYRPLNKVSVVDSYPMPRIDDILACLARAKYISIFDLSAGFHHLKIVHSDRPKTAFNTPWGLWQFRRLPFGVVNGPAQFMRAVDEILGEYKWNFVLAFIDDLIVYSETLEDHIKHLNLLLARLKEQHVNLNPEKVQFFKNKVKYLGFVIEDGKVSPDPDKLKALEGYLQPWNVKDIQRFLGFAGYYRQFIQDFSKIAKPLTSLLKKGTNFDWTDNCQESFDTLRVELLNVQALKLPDLNKEFIIQTDAADGGIGYVLLQEENGVRFPVYFGSRTLNQAERNYSVTEKECLSIVEAVKKFKQYIEFSHFTIETDHQALSWLMKLKEPAGRLARWALQLQGLKFDVKYKAGKLNRTADALSRAASIFLLEEDNTINREELIREQTADLELNGIIAFIKEGKLLGNSAEENDSIIKKAKDAFVLSDNCLLKLVGPREKPWEDEISHWNIWVPKSLKEKVTRYFHTGLIGGHLGIRKTYKKIEDRFWWKSMRKDVINFVNNCETCQQIKGSRQKPQGIGKAPPILGSWDVITVDLIGPYTRGSNLNLYALVIIDSFSKWVEIFPIRKATTEVIIKRLMEVFCRWGFSKCIISDNGSQFTSKKYTNWCKSLGIKYLFIAPYHPQANPTERYNQTVKTMVVSTIKECKDWDKYLPEILFALRTSINESSQFTPCYLNTGREFRTPIDNTLQISNSTEENSNVFGRRLALIQTLAKANMIKGQEKYMKKYNKGRKNLKFKEGDFVWLKTHTLSDASKKITASLLPKFEGPFQILKDKGSNVYDICNIESKQFCGTAHVSDLKAYYSLQNGGTKQDSV